MTSKQVFEATLIELDKLSAPAVTLESFNYFFNKAINLFVNKQYNVGADTDLQRTDDLRVLKATTVLKPSKTPSKLNDDLKNLLNNNEDLKGISVLGNANISSIYGATYEFNLPADYLHILNCICLFKVNKRINCPYNIGDIVKKGATKCNADTWPLIIDNLYMRPSYKRPYYYINNLNTQEYNPTNPITIAEDNDTGSIRYTGTDVNTKEHIETGPNFLNSDKNSLNDPNTIYTDDNQSEVLNRKIKIKIGKGADSESDDSTVIKTAGHRYGNASRVRLEVRYGLDSSVFELIGVMIDYIKAPQFIRLTLELLDLTEDTSQVLEFPEYICQEIINELVKLIMENASDPRILTLPAVSMSIAAPAQALTPQPSKK